MFLAILFWLGLCIACAMFATKRGRSGWGWFFLSALLISPLLGFIFLLVLPDLSPGSGRVDASTHVKCPECAEPVLREARKCKHCGSDLTPQPLESASVAPPVPLSDEPPSLPTPQQFAKADRLRVAVPIIIVTVASVAYLAFSSTKDESSVSQQAAGSGKSSYIVSRDELKYWIGESGEKVKQRFGEPSSVVIGDDGDRWRYEGISRDSNWKLDEMTAFVMKANRVSGFEF